MIRQEVPSTYNHFTCHNNLMIGIYTIKVWTSHHTSPIWQHHLHNEFQGLVGASEPNSADLLYNIILRGGNGDPLAAALMLNSQTIGWCQLPITQYQIQLVWQLIFQVQIGHWQYIDVSRSTLLRIFIPDVSLSIKL